MLSEEEIIKYLKGYKYDNEVYQAIQGLLDLYILEKTGNENLQILLDEEKEKNKELEQTILEFVNDRERILKTPVISKDKIREKIKELESIEPADDDYNFEMQNDIHSKINILQELLEGDNNEEKSSK